MLSDADLCNATIVGDNDIASVGVVIGFVVPGYVALFTSILYLVSQSRVRRGYCWHLRFSRPFLEAVELEESQLQKWRIRAVFAELLITPLLDVQTFTALAILIATFTQWHTITFYHAFMSYRLWDITMGSFWSVSCTFHRWQDSTTPEMDYEAWFKHSDSASRRQRLIHRMRGKARLFVVLCNSVLSLIYQRRAFDREFGEWESDTPGKCYIYHDIAFSSSTFVLVLMAADLVVVCYLATRLSDRLEHVIRFRRLVRLKLSQVAKIAYVLSFEKSDLSSTPSLTLRNLTGLFIKAIGLAIFCCLRVVQLLCSLLVLEFDHSWSQEYVYKAINLGLGFGRISWSLYDVVDLMVSNRHLIVGSRQTSWGFGQVLSVSALMYLIFNSIDSYSGAVAIFEEQETIGPETSFDIESDTSSLKSVDITDEVSIF